MVSVNPVQQAAPAASTTTQKSGNTLDYEAFLKLFVEQLKHQDPLSPMDATDSIAQLATFSQVEQTVAMNKKFEALLSSQSLGLANSTIGRTVTSSDGKVTGQVVSVRITSEGPVARLNNGSDLPLTDGITIS